MGYMVGWKTWAWGCTSWHMGQYWYMDSWGSSYNNEEIEALSIKYGMPLGQYFPSGFNELTQHTSNLQQMVEEFTSKNSRKKLKYKSLPTNFISKHHRSMWSNKHNITIRNARKNSEIMNRSNIYWTNQMWNNHI